MLINLLTYCPRSARSRHRCTLHHMSSHCYIYGQLNSSSLAGSTPLTRRLLLLAVTVMLCFQQGSRSLTRLYTALLLQVLLHVKVKERIVQNFSVISAGSVRSVLDQETFYIHCSRFALKLWAVHNNNTEDSFARCRTYTLCLCSSLDKYFIILEVKLMYKLDFYENTGVNCEMW